MIEKLILRNFQCHKKKVLNFGKITTITGPSDAGKSAVVRALRWVLLNKPSGKGVVKRGEEKCTVTVAVDGQKVKKVRKGAKATYHLGDLEYKAFGNTVPDAIVEVFALGEDNIQKQHDAPFWLSLSSGELSRTLNEVVDLSAIDTTIQTLNKWLRRAVTEVEVSEARLDTLRSKKKELAFVKQVDKDWKVIEKLQKEIDELSAMAIRVEQLSAVADTTHRSLNTARTSSDELDASLLEAAGPAGCVSRGRKMIRRVQQVVHDYDRGMNELKELQKSLSTVESKLAKYKNCPLCGGKLS